MQIYKSCHTEKNIIRLATEKLNFCNNEL